MKAILLLSATLACGMTQAADAPPVKEKATDYIRFVEGDEGDTLETAIVSFESPQKVVVDLVGAIHIADKAYFDALNQRFKTYDVVLYELVGPPMDQRAKGVREAGGENLQWIGVMQATMRDTLKLHGQLECIDYKAKNFVHADMSMKEFQNTRDKKQESFLKLYLKLWQAQTANGTAASDSSDAATLAMIINIMTKKDSSVELKRGIASQFDEVEKLMSGVEAGEGTVIVGERNRVALEVMDKQIAAGKKHLGIFYGGAHLPDMEQRLLKRGFKRTKKDWLTAWNMPYQ